MDKNEHSVHIKSLSLKLYSQSCGQSSGCLNVYLPFGSHAHCTELRFSVNDIDTIKTYVFSAFPRHSHSTPSV